MIRYLFCRVFCPCTHQHPHTRARLTVHVGAVAFTFTGDFTMQLPDDQTVSADVSYVDAKGNAATVEGAPVWASDNEAVATVTASADGFSATVTPVGPLGTAQISVTADADLGAGVVEVVALGTVEVVAGQAVAGVINFGTPGGGSGGGVGPT